MTLIRTMTIPAHQGPFRPGIGKKDAALGLGLYPGQVDAVSQGKGLVVYLPPSDHENRGVRGPGLAGWRWVALRLAGLLAFAGQQLSRLLQRLFEAACALRSFGPPVRVAGNDDVAAIGQGLADGIVGFSTHQHDVPGGQLAEIAQVGGQMPGHALAVTDDAVAGCCYKKTEHHAGAKRASDRHRGGNVRPGMVVQQGEVFIAESEEIAHLGIELHAGQAAGLPAELGLRLFQVVLVQVRVTKGVNEFPGLQVADLGHHHGQQGVRGDVERHSQEYISAALVELAGEFTGTGNVKLEKAVAGWKGHAPHIGHVPRADQDTPRIGALADLLEHEPDLIHGLPVGAWPGTPLVSVNRTQFAVFISPFVPDTHAVVFQVADVGVTLQEPEQLVNDGAQVHFFGGDQGKSLAEVKAHLVAENADRPGSGAVAALFAALQNGAQKVVVGLHRVKNNAPATASQRWPIGMAI